MSAERSCFLCHFIIKDLKQTHLACSQLTSNDVWLRTLFGSNIRLILCRPFDHDRLKPVTGARSIAIRGTL